MSKTRSNTTGRSLPTQSIRVHKWFLWVLVAQSVVFWVVFCGSIFVLLSFFFLACAMSVLLGLHFRLPLFWPVLCLSFSVYALDYPSFGLCYVCPSRFTL